ncbi:MAG: hypothetical protein WDM85_00880 [Caulobacteraceae bacterium]
MHALLPSASLRAVRGHLRPASVGVEPKVARPGDWTRSAALEHRRAALDERPDAFSGVSGLHHRSRMVGTAAMAATSPASV